MVFPVWYRTHRTITKWLFEVAVFYKYCVTMPSTVVPSKATDAHPRYFGKYCEVFNDHNSRLHMSKFLRQFLTDL